MKNSSFFIQIIFAFALILIGMSMVTSNVVRAPIEKPLPKVESTSQNWSSIFDVTENPDPYDITGGYLPNSEYKSTPILDVWIPCYYCNAKLPNEK